MDFSSEITEKLEHYVGLLKKWQKSINLVSKNTLEEAWQRHIIDSAQLSEYIPLNKSVLDLGSGAGLPAMVLAIMRSDLDVSLIESDERKCTFLRTVSRETSCPVIIFNQRIEDFKDEKPYDFVTARALAPLTKLLDYTAPFRRHAPSQEYLFLKGEKWADEIDEAHKTYKFDFVPYDSATSPYAKALHIRNVSRET